MSSEQAAGDGEENRSLLTKRQVQVLRLRLQGCSLQEVASIMGTTRSNVSKLERRAHRNIIIAEKTIHDYMKVKAPISVLVPAGLDVLRVPSLIFEAADLAGVHLPANSIDMVVQLKTKAPALFGGETLPKGAEIFITHDGKILLIDPRSGPPGTGPE